MYKALSDLIHLQKSKLQTQKTKMTDRGVRSDKDLSGKVQSHSEMYPNLGVTVCQFARKVLPLPELLTAFAKMGSCCQK